MHNDWTNWAGEHRCEPEAIVEPSSEAEVAEIVAKATDLGSHVRVAGAGHSFMPLVCTSDTLIRPHNMNQILDVDFASGYVRVETGIALHDLGIQLAQHRLGMENLGDIDVQTLGGAVGTGTHGTGSRLGNISSQIVGFRMVTASGEIMEFSEATNPALVNAARVSLGSFGVITQMTLRCIPIFTLRRVDESCNLEDILEQLDHKFDSHDHFEFFAFPYAKTALTKAMDRVDEAPQPASRMRAYVEDVVLENRAFGLACAIGKRFPRMVPRINRLSASLAGGTKRLDYGHNVFATRRDVRFQEMEYAVPREHASSAVRATLAYIESLHYPMSFPIEVRSLAADDALLSPAYKRATCTISVHMYRGVEFHPVFRGIEAIMAEFSGRPHWGKWHYHSAQTLQTLFPAWAEFQATRTRFDPNGTFSNEHLDHVLGPVGAREPAVAH